MSTAKHLTAAELTQVRAWRGDATLGPLQLWKKHKQVRRQSRQKCLCLTAFRKCLRGVTYNKAQETRGPKYKLGERAIAALDKKRRELVKKDDGEFEVSWDEIIKKARVKKVHGTTAKRALARAGIFVAAHPPREKPERTQEHKDERFEKCGKWRYLPNDYFSKEVDLIIDNTHINVPTTRRARRFKNKSKVRFQNRTRAEGLLTQYTKPNAKRNRQNLGGCLSVCAGIRKDKVVLWQYLEKNWNGEAAAKLYRGAIAKVLRRAAPEKAKPVILEDNDPTGYKSGKGKAAKKELGFKVVSLPRYSPDLNPCDYFLWDNIEARMAKSAPKNKKESVEQFKKRLRKTAMSTSKVFLRKAVAHMTPRIKAIYDAEGDHIKID